MIMLLDLNSEREPLPQSITGLRFENSPKDAIQLRREIIFSASKWDAQVGDVDAISTAPVVLTMTTWREVARLAEQLAAEVVTAEIATEEAGAINDLPRQLRRYARSMTGVRIMRFDFHPCESGWQVSEVNSDVPGGYVEAGPMARLVASHYPGLTTAGDPAAALAMAFSRNLPSNSLIALVHATAFSDDRQAMNVLATALAHCGFETWMGAPDQLRWTSAGVPSIPSGKNQRPVDGILRFYPGEWLTRLPGRCQRGWLACQVPTTNPLRALLSQNKRAPLTWKSIAVPMPTWNTLVPESACPSAFPANIEQWVIKPAWGREGAGVSMPDDNQSIRDRGLTVARRQPSHWVLQRYFPSRSIASPTGQVHVALGVFTVDGVAAGVFARVAPRPPIDHRAVHATVLIEKSP